MEYAISIPSNPKGPLWDMRGRKWARRFHRYENDNWYIAEKDLDVTMRWETLLENEKRLYDAPPQESTWKDVAANHAYLAEIDVLDGGQEPLRLKGLFSSVDGESLTSASGKIYRKGCAIIVSLREYGRTEYETLVQKVLDIRTPGHDEPDIWIDYDEVVEQSLEELGDLKKELQASLNAGEKGTEK